MGLERSSGREQVLVSGRYALGKMIGGGATGSVYKGSDTLTGEPVAIKVLRQEMAAQMPELLERFRREGEALRKLNHPNIVKILAMADQDGQHYLVMEYVGGGSLADLLRRLPNEGPRRELARSIQAPRLPVDRVVAIGLELADALSRAHHLEILHRDIKPANILLAEDGTPRLTDFGLARLGASPALTEVGSILGTFAYLSPEACYNQKLDGRADIWSFGVVLYEMLTGELPFTGDTPFEIMRAINHQPLPDLTWKRDDLPPALVELIRKMLMKDRAARIGSARLVGAELEAIRQRMKPVPQATQESISQASQEPGPQTLREAEGGRPRVEKEMAAASIPQPPAPEKIKVLIVDDHAVVRQGLRTFIDLQDDMQVIGEGENGAQAVDLARRLQPDVVLLDLVMPQMDGVEATRGIAQSSPRSRVLILTSFGEDDKVFPAIRAGAQGYLLKDIHPNDLVQAVREAHQGKVQLHPEIARKLMSAVVTSSQTQATSPAEAGTPTLRSGQAPTRAKAVSDAAHDLTERELEVLRLIARGMTNHEIAEKMVISEKTVKTHVSNVLGKLGVEDRTQAAIWALKHGLE